MLAKDNLSTRLVLNKTNIWYFRCHIVQSSEIKLGKPISKDNKHIRKHILSSHCTFVIRAYNFEYVVCVIIKIVEALFNKAVWCI